MTETERTIIQLKAFRQQVEFTYLHNPYAFNLVHGPYWKYVAQIDELILLVEQTMERTRQQIREIE